MTDAPLAGVKGTGWRRSDRGRKWYQIEPPSPEFKAWMRFYRDNGRIQFALAAIALKRTWVLGASPNEHGGAMLAYLDANQPKRRTEDD